MKYLKSFNESIDDSINRLGVSFRDFKKDDKPKTFNSEDWLESFYARNRETQPELEPELEPEIKDDKFDRIERFIRQANRIISGDFKIKKDKSVLENLFTLCDNIQIGPEEIKDIIKSKIIKDDKNYLGNLYEELRGLYSEDWSDEY